MEHFKSMGKPLQTVFSELGFRTRSRADLIRAPDLPSYATPRSSIPPWSFCKPKIVWARSNLYQLSRILAKSCPLSISGVRPSFYLSITSVFQNHDAQASTTAIEYPIRHVKSLFGSNAIHTSFWNSTGRNVPFILTSLPCSDHFRQSLRISIFLLSLYMPT